MGSVIKEGFIFILLAAVVVFLFMIVLYDFVPEETAVKVVEYTEGSEVKATLEEIDTYTGGQEEAASLLKSYDVDGSDLKRYKITNSYENGKTNPFSDVEALKFENKVSTGNKSGTTTAGSASSGPYGGSSTK